MNNLRFDVIMLAIFYMSVILFLSACSSPPITQPYDCANFEVKTILPTDSKGTQLEKLGYNTYMQGACDDGRF